MTEKKFSLGGTPRFKQLQPGEVCEFVKGSIPEQFESEWDTGYGDHGKTKWSLYLNSSQNTPILLTLFLKRVWK